MAVLDYLVHQNLRTNQLQHAVIHPLGTAPVTFTALAGQIYFDTAAADNFMKVYGDIGAGNAWNSLAWNADLTAHTGDSTIHFTVASIDHGSIAGLTDDDHGQYALLAGRAGGQTLRGGTAVAENIIIGSTANASKGYIQLEDTVRLTTAAAAAMTDGFVMRNATAGELKLLTPTGTPSGSTFLRGDGVWASPAGGFASFDSGADAGANVTVNSLDLFDITSSTGAITSLPIQTTVSKLSTTVTVDVKLDFIDDDTFAAATASNIPSSESVKAYVDNAVLGGMTYKGAFDPTAGAGAGSPDLDAITSEIGDTYTVTVAGTYNWTTGSAVLEVGDTLIAEADGILNNVASWTIVQRNIDKPLVTFTQTIGNGALVAIPVTHSLNNQYVLAKVYDATSNAEVICDIVNTSSSVTTFNFNTAPTTAQYRVVIIG